MLNFIVSNLPWFLAAWLYMAGIITVLIYLEVHELSMWAHWWNPIVVLLWFVFMPCLLIGVSCQSLFDSMRK